MLFVELKSAFFSYFKQSTLPIYTVEINSHSVVQVVVCDTSVTSCVTHCILDQKLYPPFPLQRGSPESAVHFRPHLAHKKPLVPF